MGEASKVSANPIIQTENKIDDKDQEIIELNKLDLSLNSEKVKSDK